MVCTMEHIEPSNQREKGNIRKFLNREGCQGVKVSLSNKSGGYVKSVPFTVRTGLLDLELEMLMSNET